MTVAWVHRPAPQARAAARLFCFHHAGGAAAAFRLWSAELPAGLEVCAAQLPGRANRLREPPVDSIPRLVEALVPAISPLLDVPYAFFGHSMGAVLGYEVARALAEAGRPVPAHLFVSARRPPHAPNPEPLLHPLPDDEFVRQINLRYGGIPPELLQHPDVMELVLPALRADIAALETFSHRPGPALACPISAFGGASDPRATHADMAGWRELTVGAFRMRMFPGEHFYLDSQRRDVLADISATLAPMIGAEVLGGAQ